MCKVSSSCSTCNQHPCKRVCCDRAAHTNLVGSRPNRARSLAWSLRQSCTGRHHRPVGWSTCTPVCSQLRTSPTRPRTPQDIRSHCRCNPGSPRGRISKCQLQIRPRSSGAYGTGCPRRKNLSMPPIRSIGRLRNSRRKRTRCSFESQFESMYSQRLFYHRRNNSTQGC